MAEKTISTSLSPEIYFEKVEGNLELTGWDRSAVHISTSAGEPEYQEIQDCVHIHCLGNCLVRLPYGATVHIDHMQGNLSCKQLEDNLYINQLAGNAELRNIATVEIGEIQGNLSGKQISGGLKANRIRGGAELRSIQGKCMLVQVDGNIDLREIENDLQAKAGGNIRLRLGNDLAANYQVEAGGWVSCRLPEESDATITLASCSNEIKLYKPNGAVRIDQPSYVITLGNGISMLNISAAGSIQLSLGTREPSDWQGHSSAFQMPGGSSSVFSAEKIARQVEEQIGNQMEMINRQVNSQLSHLQTMLESSDLPSDEKEKILQRAQQSSERIAARAQEKMRRGQEKLERKLEKMPPGATPSSRRGWAFSPLPTPSTQSSVSDEERLLILRMLEQKKITIQEAEKLLSALEGNE